MTTARSVLSLSLALWAVCALWSCGNRDAPAPPPREGTGSSASPDEASLDWTEITLRHDHGDCAGCEWEIRMRADGTAIVERGRRGIDRVEPHTLRLQESDRTALRAALDDPAARRGVRNGFGCAALEDTTDRLIVATSQGNREQDIAGCVHAQPPHPYASPVYNVAVRLVSTVPIEHAKSR